MKQIFSKYFPELKISICFTNNFKIQTLFQYKDTLPPSLRSSVIYKFSCDTCCHQYIGSTIRNLYIRSCEHAGRSFRTDQQLLSPVHSSIRDHKFKCDTQINLQKFKIINSTKFVSDLKILESMYIKREKPLLNDQNSAVPLLVINWFYSLNLVSYILFFLYLYVWFIIFIYVSYILVFLQDCAIFYVF